MRKPYRRLRDPAVDRHELGIQLRRLKDKFAAAGMPAADILCTLRELAEEEERMVEHEAAVARMKR